MKSSFSRGAAATPDHVTPTVVNVRRIHESQPQPVNNPPSFYIRAAGVLRYNRESDDSRINVLTILQELPPLSEFGAKCEYCGQKARPSLSVTWMQEPEAAPHFCCTQHQQLCEMLVKERALCEGRSDLTTAKEEDELVEDQPLGLKAQPEVKINNRYSIQVPTETFAPRSNILRFKLSCVNGKGNKDGPERRSEEEEPQASVRCYRRKHFKFGICHQQDGAEFLQKYYSSGKKCLTLFRGGSAQVFYPSGHLALVVVTEKNGSVCIVYDDSKAPNPVMRAVFQSDGRAACYHSNGNIWLSLDTSGGQCLDEAGARVCRWRWEGPLHPVFLSLNKSVGVRVFGRKQVFVSFLAQGQHAKFSVGACCAQGESDTDRPASGPSATKEEHTALAVRDKCLLAIKNLHQCLMKHGQNQLPKTT